VIFKLVSAPHGKPCGAFGFLGDAKKSALMKQLRYKAVEQ
jgi:hypothetical protein